ncbi:MAG: efflux RND transporter periplasmic adaptor subunit [Xanthobacteraceae bacterium]
MTNSRATAAALGLLLAAVFIALRTAGAGNALLLDLDATAPANAQEAAAPAGAGNRDTLELSNPQLELIKVAPVEERDFPVEKEAVGSIDFDADMAVQVFTPYQGKIIALFAVVGDDVKKGQTLFTIASPDLLQAESTLIAAAGVLDLTTRNLARLRGLYTTQAVSQREVEQATSDQQTAEGNLRAARDAVRIFGKSDADIDNIIAKRIADPTLVVPSPIAGRIVARNAAPGLLVQPGVAPAPYTVANIDTMWLLANVAETDSPAFHAGQPERVRVDAFPGRVFDARVTTVAAAVDPNTRRVLVHSAIKDPRNELRSGMFARFTIDVGAPVHSPAIPLDGVVREGDGTQTIWVTADRRHFTRRAVKIGEQSDGYRQILQGVQPGELAATEGAIFLSNMLATAGEQ